MRFGLREQPIQKVFQRGVVTFRRRVFCPPGSDPWSAAAQCASDLRIAGQQASGVFTKRNPILMQNGLSRWTFWHAVVMLLSSVTVMWLAQVWPVLVAMSVSLLLLLSSVFAGTGARQAMRGIANRVTLVRMLILMSALLLYPHIGIALFISMVVLVMVLDGVDGYLARKLGETSLFGEIFDMEVDAFLALGLSLLIFIDHPVAWWVLPAALLRYVFVILYKWMRWHERNRPVMPEVKVIAVVYFAGLLSSFAFGWDRAEWIVATGCALVTISFVREFYLFSRME